MSPSVAHRPSDAKELAELIRRAAAGDRRLEVRGGGTRVGVGAPRETEIVDMIGFAGVIDYDPAELVLTAGAGTPLAEIESLVASENQMLAFEPHGAAGSTIGGVVAAGVSGSRRVSRGAVRDHLLGFKAVSGRGEAFVGGAKVVKNVTGYDLPKLAAGSWGRLFALTEVTLKVLSRSPETITLAAEGLDAAGAVALMSRALGSQADVAAAACADGVTALRLEGFGPSVAARRALLEGMAPLRALPEREADAFWSSLTEPLPDAPALWRLGLPASRAAEIAEEGFGSWSMDWGGARLWLGSAEAAAVRAAAERAGGHATLVRAPEDMRRTVPVLHPHPAPLAALEARVRRAFDPVGVFETGRFLDEAHAD
ncbi:MAG: glycolate oxidase subunit GlcE [Caulobacteraceae bacterium]